MTTFTMQDLTTTQEEEANMDQIQALTEKQMEQLQAHEEAHKVVQGVTGAQYEVIDVKKFEQPQTIDHLINQLTQTFSQLLTAITEQKQTQTQPSQGLQDAVDTVLQSAEWFKEMVESKAETVIDDMDHTYEIESAVDSFFSDSFSLDDYVDVQAEIESKVEDIVERIVEDKLNNATISVNF